MTTTGIDIFGDDAGNKITVYAPGSAKPIHLRYPSFAEWHELARQHQGLTDGRAPEASLIAKTIATCLCDESGKPLGGDTAAALMKSSPKRVMWLYTTCWETVLRNDDTVKEQEKNSVAGTGA